MLLPSKAQVSTAGRYAGTILGTAIAIFGLQAKGISPDQVTAAIAALGTVVNDIVVLVSTMAPIYLTIRGLMTSTSRGQAAAIGANASTIVNPGPNGTATVTLTNGMAAAALDAQKKAA